MILFLWPGFGDVFQHPNGYIFAKDGDGLKNYFNLGYYLKYDHGLDFSGVNYPYGENLLYTDTQPFYALFLNFIDDHIWSIANNSVAIVNLSILFGMVLAGIILFLILSYHNLPLWYSVILAISIAFMSPQWDRIHGHLSLSYGFVIPLIWYLLIRYNSSASNKIGWSVAIGSAGLLAGGLHLYYLMITSGFIGTYVFITWLTSRFRRQPISLDIKLIGAALLPIVVIFLISEITNTAADRPSSPYGFFVYHATLESIFLPHYGAINTLLGRFIRITIPWEGRAFIGTAALIFTLGVIITLVVRLLKKDHTVVNKIPDLSNYGYAALVMLLFSMCIPFEWLRFIPDLIPPLKQFRALGRLSWIFYYVINVIAAIYFFRLWQELKLKNIRISWTYTFLILVLILWIFDSAAFYLNHGPVGISPNDKLENRDDEYLSRFQEVGFRPEEFQGIFSIPLVAIRTDKMTVGDNLTAHNEAMKCAFHTGIPIIQSTASRPSLSQSFSSIQLIASPMIKKVRLADMDHRPVLLLHSKGSTLKNSEKRLLVMGELFWEDDYIQLLKLPVSAFQDILEENSRFVEAIQADSTAEHLGKTMMCTPSCHGVVFKSFENRASGPAFFGLGSLKEPGKQLTLLDTSYLVKEDESKELSFWIYIDPTFPGMPSYDYQYGSDNDHLKSEGRIETRDLLDIDQGWLRINLVLKPAEYHRILLHGKNTTVDNLMIRDVNQNILVIEGNQKLYNNFLVY